MQPSPAYYAVIPADVRYAEAVQPNAKLLYGEITALCNQEGYCWASNDYFAELYGVTASTISRWISALEKRGYIRTEMVATETGSERHIYGGIFVVDRLDGGSTQKAQDPRGGVRKNAEGGLRKKRKQNNITVNNTPHNPPTKGTGRTRRKGPREAPDWEPARFEGLWRFYPSKGKRNKQRAMDAWDKLRPSKAVIDAMAAALKKLTASEEWQKGIGIPHVATFLNNLDDYLGNAAELGDVADDGQAHTVRSSLPPL